MSHLLFPAFVMLTLFCFSYTPKDHSLMKPGTTILTGTVTPYDPGSDVEALVVSCSDLNSGETVRHRCPIDSLGRFQLELDLPHTIEAFIGAREYYHILLIPNQHAN